MDSVQPFRPTGKSEVLKTGIKGFVALAGAGLIVENILVALSGYAKLSEKNAGVWPAAILIFPPVLGLLTFLYAGYNLCMGRGTPTPAPGGEGRAFRAIEAPR